MDAARTAVRRDSILRFFDCGSRCLQEFPLCATERSRKFYDTDKRLSIAAVASARGEGIGAHGVVFVEHDVELFGVA
jgi:hypothetical protein